MRREKQENEDRAKTAESELSKTKQDLFEKLRLVKDRATQQIQKIQQNTHDTIDSYLVKFQQQVENFLPLLITIHPDPRKTIRERFFGAEL